MPSTNWTQAEAIEFVSRIHPLTAEFGCYVALTGGCLYKAGERKDIDVLFYRIRQVNTILKDELLAALVDNLGIELGDRKGWCRKATWHGKKIDFFFPELDDEWEPGATLTEYPL